MSVVIHCMIFCVILLFWRFAFVLANVTSIVDYERGLSTSTTTVSTLLTTDSRRSDGGFTISEERFLEDDAAKELLYEMDSGHLDLDSGVPEDDVVMIKEPYEKDSDSGGGGLLSTWIDKLKSLFKPSTRNSVLGHAMEVGNQFKEKYGSGSPPPYQSLNYGDFQSPNAPHRPYPGAMRPDGAFSHINKPAVKLTLSADFVELNCVVYGRIQQGIRWVKLVGLNPHGHQLFATVADGDRILFDTYHFGVRTDGKHSRLIIRNPDPSSHYGVYQCQVSVAGDPSVIVKEDFVVGKVS